MAYSPVQQYKEQAIKSMTNGELLLLLYDEAIKNLKVSIMLLEKGDDENFANCLQKAKDIFFYLNNICDTQYEISKDLKDLYQFLNNQLVTAEFKKDKKYVEDILPIVKDLRDTWTEANRLTSKG